MTFRQRTISFLASVIVLLGSFTLLLIAGAVLRPIVETLASAIRVAKSCG